MSLHENQVMQSSIIDWQAGFGSCRYLQGEKYSFVIVLGFNRSAARYNLIQGLVMIQAWSSASVQKQNVRTLFK